MALTAGTRLGHFEVRSPLGAGGMGEVYRARDLALDRDVALKVLPDAVAADPQRLARFGREARAAAALNHPNVLTVFEVGTEGRPYVAAELLTGHTLWTILGQPLPVARAVDYAIQIANGLAAAHAKGIVHRDIKPDNLFVTRDGRVKILDFGIAMHAEPAGDGAHAPTLTVPGGMIGTPGYMAPEQVRGQPVDARADIFALGAALYEMLTGRRAFSHDTTADSITAVLKDDPPSVAELVPGVPPGLAQVVQRCLAKAPEQRFQSAADLAFALRLATEFPAAPADRARRRPAWVFLAAALIAVALAVAAGTRFGSPTAPVAGPRRTSISFPASAPLGDFNYVPFTVSPDGTLLAYTTDQPERLVVRPLASYDVRPLAATEGAYDPFFSPDGQWLGFWSFGQIKKVPVAGGPTVPICDAPDLMGASWGPDGSIVFAPGPGEPLRIVPASGGTPQALTSLEAGRNEMLHAFPQFIDGGRAVLFTAVARSKEAPFTVDVIDMATKARRTVVAGAQYGRHLPSGHLLYARDRQLFAVMMTPGTSAPVGQPRLVLDGVHTDPQGQALFSVGGEGTLAYMAPEPPLDRTLVWVDRAGAVTDAGLPAKPYSVARLSPDGKTIAVNILDATSSDIWIASIERATLERFTFGRGLLWSFPTLAFSPDGRQLAYAMDGDGESRMMAQAVDRSSPSRELMGWKFTAGPSQWLRGQDALLASIRGLSSGGDLIVVHPTAGGPPTALMEGPGNQFGATASADERYVTYASDETGRFEVFVAPLQEPGAKRQLTTEGGVEPVWSPSGAEIFYRVGNRMMAIPVTTAPALVTGRPRLLFEGQFAVGAAGLPAYDVARDGRFLMLRLSGARHPSELRVVLNWLGELEQLSK